MADDDALVEELAEAMRKADARFGSDYLRSMIGRGDDPGPKSAYFSRALLPIIRRERKAAAVEALREIGEAIPCYKGALSAAEIIEARRRAYEAGL